MKGKKINSEFINSYIEECVSNNLNTPDMIVNKAKQEISKIDDCLKQILFLKKRRSSLNDVISFLSNNESKKEITYNLNLFDLSYKDISIFVRDNLNHKNSLDISILTDKFEKHNVFYFIKQMINSNILVKMNNRTIAKGPKYYEYINVALKVGYV